MSGIADMMRFGKFLGGGGVSSWNDLTDKPFGEEVVEINYISDDGFVYNENEGQFIASVIEVPVGGETYTVNYNGTDYRTIAIKNDSAPVVLLGNVGALGMGEPTSEPFAVMFNTVQLVAVCIPLDGAQKVNVTIRGVAKTVKKIDEIFYNAPCIYYCRTSEQGTKWLYSDNQYTVKVTKEEFDKSYRRPIVIMDEHMGQFYPMTSNYDGEYGCVCVPVIKYAANDWGVAGLSLYTAEYTG